MKFILLSLSLILFGCRAEKNLPHAKSTVESAENKLHGVWESLLIRSKEKFPPKKITLKFTAYNDTKLIWMKMIAEGVSGEKFNKTIRVSVSEKKGYIIPSVRKELETSQDDDRVIRYDTKRNKQVQGLEWKYNLTEDRLTIEMEGSLIVLRRKQ